MILQSISLSIKVQITRKSLYFTTRVDIVEQFALGNIMF